MYYNRLVQKLLTIYFIWLPSHLSGQALNNYQFRAYTQEDGLASGVLKGIGQDSTGFIWLLSESGLSRFDGYSFKIFRHDTYDESSISSSNFSSMIIDKDKRIIFRTENCISQFLPDSSTFKKLIPPQNLIDALTYIVHPAGCWLAKPTELSFINSESKVQKKFPYPRDFILRKGTVLKELNGYFWLSDGTSILRFNPITGQFTKVPVSYLHPQENAGLLEPKLFFTNDKNNVCFFSIKGLFKLNNKNQSFYQYAVNAVDTSNRVVLKKALPVNKEYLIVEMSQDIVYSIHINSGKTIPVSLKSSAFPLNMSIHTFEVVASAGATAWVSTSNAGAFHIDLENATVVEHLYSNGSYSINSTSDNIEFIMECQGVLWMTSPGIGLIKAEREHPLIPSFRPVNENSSIKSADQSNVRAISQLDSNNLLIGTLGGLHKFNKANYKFTALLSPIDGKPVMNETPVSAIIVDNKNNIWISNWGHDGITVLNYYKKQLRIIQPDNNPAHSAYNSIRSMFIDSYENLWIGTDNNIIYRLNTKNLDLNANTPLNFEKFSGSVTANDILIFNVVFTFAETKKRQILIGTQAGMYLYDYATSKFKRFCNNTNTTSSISDNDVRFFYTDKSNNLWIATHEGGLNLAAKNLDQFTVFNKDKGLPDNTIYTILNDNSENLWLATNKGICYFNPHTYHIQNYFLKDGLQNYEFNTNAAFKTADGQLVFGGINGFNMFYPDSIKMVSGIPKVVLSELKVNDKDYPISDNLVLNYDQNSISFQFSALSYFRSRENLYAYKLDGVNNNWIYSERRRFSNYAGLPPGDYTFHAKACNYNSIWNEQGVTIHFTINPPFWKTWWFKALILLAIVAITYFIFQYRLRQKLKLELLRNKIARDLHDEIGSNLSSISLFAAAAKERDGKEATHLSPLLRRISDYTQSSQESMNDIVWMINSRNDDFENIIIRMRKRAGEVFESTSVQLHMQLDEALTHTKINMDNRQNFYLIYKEALNNIAKYAACNNVWIELKLVGSQIFLSVKDDGKGFYTGTPSHGNGIINMKNRAALLKGNLQITSSPGNGTSLELTFSV